MFGEDDGRPWKGQLESNYESLQRQAGAMGFILWPRADEEIHRTKEGKWLAWRYALRSLWQWCLKGGGDGWQRAGSRERNEAGRQFRDYPIV